MNQPRGLLKLLKLDSLIQNLIEYIEIRIGIIKAEAKDDILKAMRAAMIYGAIAVLGLFFVLFLSVTIALVLNAVLESRFWGFVIVTGLYLIMLVTLFLLRNSEKVKNMFGDGSLAFLKKDGSPEAEENKDKQGEEDIEREAAVRKVEYQRREFEDRKAAESASNGKATEIHIEKKKEH